MKYIKSVLALLLFLVSISKVEAAAPSISPSNTQTICLGDTVTFSVTNPPASVTYTWLKNKVVIPNETKSTLKAYASGNYSVVLNNTDTVSSVQVILNPDPLASFSFTQPSGCGSKTVQFTNLSTGGTGSTSMSYLWEFSDGTSETKKDPKHTFNPSKGSGSQSFSVKLTTTNSFGCRDDTTINFTLNKSPDATLSGPGATILNGEPYFKICSTTGQTFDFDNASSTTSINTAYRIRWGDGSANFDSTEFKTTKYHAYSVGIKKLTFIVQAGACYDSTVYNIFIGNTPAGGVASIGGSTICAGDSIKLLIINTKTNPAGTFYVLSFNDNSIPDTFYHPAPDTVSHVFKLSSCGSSADPSFPNSFGASLNWYNPCGGSGGKVYPIFVSDKPTPDFTINLRNLNDTICVGQSATFDNTGTPGQNVENGVCTPGKSIWNLSSTTPGGSWTLISGATGSDNNKPEPVRWTNGDNKLVYQFPVTGIYNMSLKMGNNTLCGADSIAKKVCVNPLPTAAFSTNVTEGCGPLTVNALGTTNIPTCGFNRFVWTITYTPTAGCAPATSSYSYLSATNSASQNPSFQFTNPGIYTITLQTFAPGNKCSSTPISKQITVRAKPSVVLSSILDTICQNQSIAPSASATCYIDGTTTYNWSFPTGTPATSNLAIPGTIVFNTPGTQNISLNVTNICGTTNQTTPITINPLPVVPAITGPNAVCVGSTIQLINTVTGGSLLSSNPAVATVSITGIVTGISQGTTIISYTVTINGCSTTVTKTITVNPKPTLSIAGTNIICLGKSTTLVASSSITTTSYVWSPATALNTTTNDTVIASPTVNTTYTVTGTTSAGCSNTASIIVSVAANPVVTVNSPSLCIGSSTTLTATGASSYIWAPSTTLSATTGASVTANPTSTSTYTVIGIVGSGTQTCRDTATATVTVNLKPTVTVNSATSCLGTAVTLTASGADTYSWSSATGLSSTTDASVTATPSSTTTYIVTGTNSSTQCSSTATSVVTINPLPIVTVNSPSICPGSTASLTATGADTYAWAASATLNNLTNATVIASPTTTTSYVVTGTTTATGCKKTATSIVTVVSNPIVKVDSQAICIGASATLTATGATSYTWSPATGLSATTGASVMANPTTTTIYTVIGSNGIGCKNTATSRVLVNPLPTITVNSLTTCLGTSVALTATGANAYSWTGTGLSSTSGTTVNANPSVTTSYIVTGTNTTTQCSNKDTAVVTINPLPPVTVNSTSICAGTSAQLTAAGADSYTWTANSSLNTTSGSIVTATPASTTTYYVTGKSNSTSCEKTVSSIVTVLPLPVIASTSQNPSTCGGTNGSITISGLNNGSAYNLYYTFANTPYTVTNAVAQVNGTIVFSNLKSGTYSNIYVSLNGCNSNILNPITLSDPTIPSAPTFNATTAICSGNTLTLSIANPITNGIYNWSGPNGFTATGTSVNFTNSTTTISGLYQATVTSNACVSGAGSITATVNQTPQAPIATNPPPYCQAQTATALVAAVDQGAILKWYNSQGNALPGAPIPSTTNVGTQTFYVSQTSSNNCPSPKTTILVTINPTPTIPNQVLAVCSSDGINFTPTGASAGTMYTWVQPVEGTPGSLTGGTAQAVKQSSIIQTLINSTNTAATMSYIVKPTIGTCVGPNFDFVVTVNPKASISSETLQTICSGTSFNYNPSTSTVNTSNLIPAGTQYKWTIKSILPLNSITGASNVTIPVNTIGQTLTNVSNVQATVIYEVVPVSGNCDGAAFDVTIKVDPKPKIPNLTAVICSGESFSTTPSNAAPTTIVPATTLYTWPAPTSSGTNAITGGTAETNVLATISQLLVNTTTTSQTLTYVVTPTAGNCTGPTFNLVVTVNPKPSIAPKNATICSGTAFSISPTDAPIGTLYTWNAPVVVVPGSVTGGSAQSNATSTISQVLTNTTNIPAAVRYTVSPSSGSCGGGGFEVEVLVNPKPTIPAQKDTICNGESFSILPQNNIGGGIIPNGTTYTWSLPTSIPIGAITGGSSQPNPQSTIAQTLLNSTDAPGTLKYVVTPTSALYGNCVGSNFDITILVNPDSKAIFNPTDTIGCPPYLINSTRVGLQTYPNRNKDYTWYIDNALQGTGLNLPNYTMVNEDDTITLKLVTTSLYGCKSDSLLNQFITYKIPHPTFDVSDSVGCGPLTVTFKNNTPDLSAFTYAWNFGNGRSSNLATPGSEIYYPNPTYGDTTYNVKLSVTSSCNIATFTQTIRVKSKPKVLFTPTRTIGCSPMQVTFSNTSKGLGNRYVWDFGDGYKDSSLVREPISHTYITSVRDTFYAKLYAINDCGTDSSFYQIIVDPNTILLDFAVNAGEKEGCVNHTVHFINNTSGANAFRWDFGDGNVLSTNKNIDTVTHTYLKAGNYQVLLYATNGCTDTTSTELISVFGLPTPDFKAVSYKSCIGDSISLTNNSTGADSYFWQFGDGATTSFVNPGHAYSQTGLYTISLIAYKTNINGVVCSDSIQKIVNIVDTLQINYSVSDSVSSCPPLKVVFNNIYRDNILSTWNFGDGTSAQGDSVEHVYTRSGTYNSTLYVKASGGCNYVGSKDIIINSPTGSVSFNTGYRCINESIRFEASPTATDSISWDFGDGTILKTDKRLVYHQYLNPGNYIPVIKFISNTGCEYNLMVTDTIKIDRVVSGFSYIPEYSCGNTRMDFKDSSNAFYGIKSIQWDLGDGTSSNVLSFSHNYSASNTYLIKSIVISNSGCSDTSITQVPVFVRSLPSVQIGTDSIGCTDKEVKLEAYVKSKDQITLLKWIASSGDVYYGSSYINTYSQEGAYQYKFITGTEFGCYDTTSVSINIYKTPVVNAAPDVTICEGNNVTLTATGADLYNWYPSDGLSCIACQSPIATPLKTTPYTVKGTSVKGCYTYDTLTITVIPKIHLKFNNEVNICVGDSVQLLVSGAKYYEWTPSLDLSADNIQNPIAKPTRTTRYRVIGFDDYNCSRDTGYILVGVGQYPTVDLGPDQLLATGTLFPLKPIITEGPIQTWLWSPVKDLSCIDCPNPYIRVRNQITYFVTATNFYGCSGSDSITIKVFCENSQVFIPNAFTPDNDGRNDIFMVRASGIQEIKSFRIFNRWGELVFDKANFQPNDPNFGWNGKIKGVVPGPDVFVYTLEVICDDGTSYFYKGNVSLLK